MIIKNAKVFLPEGRFSSCSVEFDDRIRSVGELSAPADLDAKGCYLLPGLVDIHTHGAMSADFSDGDPCGIEKAAEYYLRHGVTSFCATTMTLPEEQLTKAVEAIAQYNNGAAHARCAGVYLEGPFLSYAKRGAQNAEYLHTPDIGLLQRLQTAAGGKVVLCGIAPEEDGTMEFIREASKVCTVSLAHTAANYDTAAKAFSAGASQVTHLFNGMNPFLHREPGVIGAAMDHSAYAELICDGLHVHESAVRAAFRMFEGRIILISDSLRCAGMPDGQYELGGQQVLLQNKKATLSDGTLAGSCISLMDALHNAVSFGIPLETAILACTRNPARAIGKEHEIGTIQEGALADFVLLNQTLNIKAVILGGKVVNIPAN